MKRVPTEFCRWIINVRVTTSTRFMPAMKRIPRTQQLILLAVCVSIVSGCAFGTRHVSLTYAPALPAEGATPVYGRVAVMPLGDARAGNEGTGTLLGKVRNGYRMPTASVLANQDPVLWVSEGLARSLIKQGFTVDRIRTQAEARDAPIVTGIVNRASGTMTSVIDANVVATVEVLHRGASVGMVKCEGRAEQGGASAEDYRRVFEAAMTVFAGQCGPKLANILTGGEP